MGGVGGGEYPALYNAASFEPGVDRNIALHAPLTTRNNAFSKFCLPGSFIYISPIFDPCKLTCVTRHLARGEPQTQRSGPLCWCCELCTKMNANSFSCWPTVQLSQILKCANGPQTTESTHQDYWTTIRMAWFLWQYEWDACSNIATITQ